MKVTQPVSITQVFLKLRFLFVTIKSIQVPVSDLKHVFNNKEFLSRPGDADLAYEYWFGCSLPASRLLLITSYEENFNT